MKFFDFSPRKIIYANNTSSALEMVKLGLGYSFFPKSYLNLESNNLALIDIENENISFPTLLVVNKNQGTMYDKCLDCMEELLKDVHVKNLLNNDGL